MDTTQVLLVIVISVLTGMLVLIGLQLVFILKEFKRTVEKVNKILDDTGTISESVSKPISLASQAITNLKTPATILSFFLKGKTKSKEEKE